MAILHKLHPAWLEAMLLLHRAGYLKAVILRLRDQGELKKMLLAKDQDQGNVYSGGMLQTAVMLFSIAKDVEHSVLKKSALKTSRKSSCS